MHWIERVAAMMERVTVGAGAAPVIEAKKDEPAQQAPSANVANLQRRVAGVLPVRLDIPRSGVSCRFARALVLDEETTVSLRYRKR